MRKVVRNIITHQRLKDALGYDPVSGSWTWLIQTQRSQTKIGDNAGHVSKRSGQLEIRVDGRNYSARKLAFFYMNGQWPDRRMVGKGTVFNNLKVGQGRRKKGLKRPAAATEEERLDRRRIAFREWYAKNGPRPWTPERGKIRADAATRYRKRHPEKVIVERTKRRAREMNAQGSHSAGDLREILSAQHGKCAYCKIRLNSKNKHLDHIVALAKGGSNAKRNLQFLCSHCNQRKSDKDSIDFCRQRGMLL